MKPFASVALFAWILLGGNPVPHLDLIDNLNQSIQLRFTDPTPQTLGMSRVAFPSSFGTHFRPNTTLLRDFNPETPAEKTVLAELERQKVQVGLYVFGAAVTTSTAQQLDYRALKGPAAITAGTPRPAWYPSLPNLAVPKQDTLPDWKAIYPFAAGAMKSFTEGREVQETKMDSWHISIRPILATSDRCISCHQVALNRPIGGVVYAFRQLP